MYRLSKDEVFEQSHSYAEESPKDYKRGLNSEANRLIPFIEQKDSLLRECREFIEKTGLQLFDDQATELLTKLKEI